MSTAAWSSPETSTVSPLPAPSVMINSAELASTASSPGMPMSTSESRSAAASEMIAAGRACRPTADPTTTVLLGMVLLGWVGSRWSCGSDGGGVGVAGSERLQGDDGERTDDHAGGQRDQVAQDAVDGEEDEDAAVRGPDADVHGHAEAAGDRAAQHDGGDDAQRVGSGERDRALGDEAGAEQPPGLAVLALRDVEQARTEDGREGQGD